MWGDGWCPNFLRESCYGVGFFQETTWLVYAFIVANQLDCSLSLGLQKHIMTGEKTRTHGHVAQELFSLRHERKAFWSSLHSRVVQVLASWDLPYHLAHNYTSEYNHVYHVKLTDESEHGPGVTTPLMKHLLSSQITSHLDVSLTDYSVASTNRYSVKLQLHNPSNCAQHLDQSRFDDSPRSWPVICCFCKSSTTRCRVH